MWSVFPSAPLQPSGYQPVCVQCNKPREESTKCQRCESSPPLLPCQQLTTSSPTPRPPIRSQPGPGPNSSLQNFYKPVTAVRAARIEALPARIPSSRGTLPLLPNGRTPLLAGTSGCCGSRNLLQKRTAAQPELNDPSESSQTSTGLLSAQQGAPLPEERESALLVIRTRQAFLLPPQSFCPAMRRRMLITPAREAPTGWTASPLGPRTRLTLRRHPAALGGGWRRR